MRTTTAAVALLCALAWPFPGDTQWKQVVVDGERVCQHPELGILDPRYSGRADVTKACNSFTDFEAWLNDILGMSIAEAQMFLLAPAVDVPPAIPAGWSQGEYFGTADPHTSGQTAFVSAGSVFTATNIGGRFYFTDDSGAHWRYTLDPAQDFTATVRVDSLDLVNGVKAFLQVRDENQPNSAHASVEMDPSGFIGVQRVTTAGETSIPFGSFGTPVAGACLRISNDGSQDSILLEYAPDDGAANDCSNPTYVVVGQVFASWASTNDTKYVVMSCASVNPNPGANCSVAFSAVTISTAAVTHGSGATVGWSATSLPFQEDAGTVALTATLSGANPDGCTITVNSVNGSAIAGTDFTAISGATLTWTSGQTGNRTQNLVITNRAGVQSPQDRGLTVVLTKNTCVAPTLVNATANVTIIDDDASAPGTGVFFIANSECKATVSGATDAIKDANCILTEWGNPSDPGSDLGTSQLCIPPTPGFDENFTDPDCAHPNVYAYLSNDSANGGPSAARAGTYFTKLRKAGNQVGGYWAALRDSQFGDATQNRAMVQDPADILCVQREPCWIGFSIWIPSSFTGESILHAIHQPDPQPSIDLFEIVNGTMRMRTRHYDGDCCDYGANAWYLHGPNVEPGTSHTFISTGTTSRTFPTGQWVDIVKKVVLDERTSGVGEYDLYVNGTLEVEYNGPLGFKNAAGSPNGYPWWGSYRVLSDTSTIVTYFDEVRVGGSTSSFADVDPESYD